MMGTLVDKGLTFFIDQVNMLHPTIKITAEHYKEETNFCIHII